jgi:hypothetical protein
MMFTVIALLDSTGEVFVDHVAADGPQEAMALVATQTGHPRRFGQGLRH